MRSHLLSMEEQGSVAVQMSGAGPGHFDQEQPSYQPAPSSNTPARATINKHAKVAVSESNEHTSPMAKPGTVVSRKRKGNDDAQNVHAVEQGAETADNLTVINTSSRLAQPSGRGEVGGSMVHVNGDICAVSRLAVSYVLHAAASNPAASVHMAAGGPADSGSIQQEEEARKGRGRLKAIHQNSDLQGEGSISIMSPNEGHKSDLPASGIDSVRRGRGRPRGSKNKSKAFDSSEVMAPPPIEASRRGRLKGSSKVKPKDVVEGGDANESVDRIMKTRGGGRARLSLAISEQGGQEPASTMDEAGQDSAQ
ncbi:hypothetical protein CEUSTIGMA_g11487.t1 [Chlamydomonas eustigma]|uniref:Uncharacterized protein n=1 Tax=Chlamydomonas eustigma TaxID=1157962 RepID=A0A250XM02_9CHLO|nr:hypothetical protein CEUSTIGMA_g11487.t1 [Chlamydomonas eustigma]|eukprot:GAX84063.1 hypothetical protein CEUSTIGMA_g11487.t1 [Chlamydomonas eustigma]